MKKVNKSKRNTIVKIQDFGLPDSAPNLNLHKTKPNHVDGSVTRT